MYGIRHRLSICVRGGANSYGDMILNDRNMLLDTSLMNRIRDFDERRGLVTVQPGVKVVEILEAALPRRLTLSACPSEPTVTVAGAIGGNVNGKDAWRRGNFGDQVAAFKLMLASGEVIEVDRQRDHALFSAVIGGMGLLGIIVQATLRLHRIPSPLVEISRTPIQNLGALLAHLEQVEADSDFAVVWLDTCARGTKLGRAVVHATRWVDRDGGYEHRRAAVAASARRLHSRRRLARRLSPATKFMLWLLLQVQKPSICLSNLLYFHYSRLRQHLNTAGNVESFLRYNFDASFMIPSAAAVCGPRGYTVQVTIPRAHARQAITELIRLCQDSPCLPAKLILRIHRRDDYCVSFSEDGYSLNFELHPKRRHQRRMSRFLDELFGCVIRYGGKVHLAKDHVLTRCQFQKLFPRHGEFLQVKRRVDPHDLFQSDMYRRLIRGDAAAGMEGADSSFRYCV